MACDEVAAALVRDYARGYEQQQKRLLPDDQRQEAQNIYGMEAGYLIGVQVGLRLRAIARENGGAR